MKTNMEYMDRDNLPSFGPLQHETIAKGNELFLVPGFATIRTQARVHIHALLSHRLLSCLNFKQVQIVIYLSVFQPSSGLRRCPTNFGMH